MSASSQGIQKARATDSANLALLEKVNSVFLGTRDFRALADHAVNLISRELEHDGILSVSVFRVHESENLLRAYAFSSRAFDAVNKLYPKKFSELSISLDATSNLLVKAVCDKEEQEGDTLYEFARPVLSEKVSTAIQRLVGARHGIAYPLRLKQGKVIGVVLFSTGELEITAAQRTLLDAFRSQLELAFENVIEFERVVERYKRATDRMADEDKPSVHFMLRISPKQNTFLETRAREMKLDKTSFIRAWIDKERLRAKGGA